MDPVIESSEHITGEDEHHFVTIQVTSEQESALEAFFQINSWQLIKEAKSDSGEEDDAHSLMIAVTDEQEAAIDAFFQINNWTLLKGVSSDVMDGESITEDLRVDDQHEQSHTIQLHHSETMVEEVAGLQEMKVTTTGENGQPQIITLYAEARNSKGLPQSLLNEINGVGDGNGDGAVIIQEITLPDGISLDQGLVIASSHNMIRKVTPRGTVKPGDRVHKCHVCGKTFKQAQSFNGHYQTHFGAKPYQCGICNTGFTLKAALVAHQSIHTGAKPFVCTMCNKGFRRKDDMMSHLRTHTGEKPYECEICGKKFKYRNQIPKHHRAHTGDKPYACSVCQKRFTSNIHLRRHERTHTGERPYKCDTCGKAFTQYGHLQAHSRIHTDERPYACEICGRRFREKKVMKRHELLHTTERKFKCEDCGRGFLRQSNLDLHSVMHQKGPKEGLKRPRPRSKKKQADIQMREFVTNVLSSVRKVDSGMQTDNFVRGITIHDETGNATDNLSAFVNFAVEQENNTVTKVEQISDDSDIRNLTENGHYTLVMQEDGNGGYLISNYDGSAVSEEIVDTMPSNQIEVTTDFDRTTALNNLEVAVKQENYDDANTTNSVASAVEKILCPEKFDNVDGPVSVSMLHGSVNVIYVQALSDVHQVKDNAVKTEPQSVMDTSLTK